MLNSITLKFTENTDITLPVVGITLFVGPNNSGKSLVLKEVERCTIDYPSLGPMQIVRDFDIKWPHVEEVKPLLEAMALPKPSHVRDDRINIGRIDPNEGLQTTRVNIDHAITLVGAAKEKHWWATHVVRWGLVRLDGRSRFNLTNDRPAGDLLTRAENLLQHLFTNDEARKKVREFIHDAFGLYLTIDPMSLGNLRMRLSTTPSPDDEQSLNESARTRYLSMSPKPFSILL